MISHHYKCVFIHIPKNAGQSIEHVFLNLLGLTWETRAPLLLRYNDQPGLGPPRLAHLKAHEYIQYKYMTEEQFSEYFKFAFVRNPWDRLVSFYKYLGFARTMEFKRFVMHTFAKYVMKEQYWFVGPQSDYVFDQDGKLLVDFIGRFETLQEDFNTICLHLGLPPTILSHVNKADKIDQEEGSGSRRAILLSLKARWLKWHHNPPAQFRHYQDYYDTESQQFVGELFQSDVARFGYQFDTFPDHPITS